MAESSATINGVNGGVCAYTHTKHHHQFTESLILSVSFESLRCGNFPKVKYHWCQPACTGDGPGRTLCVHNRCFVYITLVFRSKFVWRRMASKRNYNGQQQQQPTTTTITATALAKHAGQLIYCHRKAFRQCGLGSFTMAMHSITTKSQQIPLRRLNWKSESDWASKRQTGGRKWRTDQMLCISRFIWRTDLISLYHEHFKQWFGHYFVIMYH